MEGAGGEDQPSPARRPIRWLLLALALVVVAVGAAIVWRAQQGDGSPGAGATPTPTASHVPTVLYVAPTGQDGHADGTEANPFGSLPAATAAAGPGDRILVAGGTYPITAPAVVSQPGVSVAALPGEHPVFDGSIAVTSVAVGADGKARIPYLPMPARPGQGLTAGSLLQAQFENGMPTGLAADRGWRCVREGDYSVPAPTAVDPDGCPEDTRPTVIVGYYPDQVWVGDRRLTQVLDEARVGPGRFFVDRSAATDAEPQPSTLVLDASDAADPSLIRVSGSSGAFLRIGVDGVQVSGLTVQRHSGDWAAPAVVIGPVSGTRLSDLTLRDIATIGVSVAGRRDPGILARDTTITGLVTQRAGWSGLIATYTDDTTISGSQFLDTDPDVEFQRAPQRGAIKATRDHRMRVVDSVFAGNSTFALWWDQSNYDVTVARTRFTDNGEAAVFYEISHGLTMVDNLITGVRAGPSVRLAGSSGLTLVNNTIVGGQGGVAVLTDARSRDYTPGRPCSEHPQRYGEPGDLARCNIVYPSELDRIRPGAFGGPGTVNETPLLTWRPGVDLMINNVLADPTGAGMCSQTTSFCVVGYTQWTGELTQVPLNEILSSGTELDGNVYQSSAPIALTRAGPNQEGEFAADSLDALRGPTGLGSTYYGLSVEQHGLAGPGWVTATGTPTAALLAQQGSAAPVPTDPAINEYVAAGTRTYGSSLVAGQPQASPPQQQASPAPS